MRFAREWRDVAEAYVQNRMRQLGISEDNIGAGDAYRGIPSTVFNPEERSGGYVATGITLNSGLLNPRLLEGKGSTVSAAARLRDRIDAVIAHEWTEYVHGTHELALKRAAETELPISEAARRILRAMGR